MNLSHKDALSGSKKHCLKCWNRVPDDAFKNRLISDSDSFSSVEITQVSAGVDLSSHSRVL